MISAMQRRWHALSPTGRGIAAMVASTFAFSAMHAAIRYISAELHPFQIAFARNFFGLLVFLPIVVQSGFGFLRTTRLPLHVLRSVMNVCAMLSFFTALSITPIALVTALGFTAPIFMSALSVLVLRERSSPARWAAVLLGAIGTLVVVRPGAAEAWLGPMLVVMSAAIWACTMVVIKVIARTDSSLTITGYMSILLSLLSLGPAVYVWQWPTLEAWIYLVGIGVVGTVAQLSLAEALKQTDATAVMPFDFLKLVWAALLGLWLFAEVPEITTWIGALIIFGAGLIVVYHERLTKPPRV